MQPSQIAAQLRSLAGQNRNNAEFFDIAADLHEQGYQSDEARIETEIRTYKDENSVDALNERIATLETENAVLKTENEQLKSAGAQDVEVTP